MEGVHFHTRVCKSACGEQACVKLPILPLWVGLPSVLRGHFIHGAKGNKKVALCRTLCWLCACVYAYGYSPEIRGRWCHKGGAGGHISCNQAN